MGYRQPGMRSSVSAPAMPHVLLTSFPVCALPLAPAAVQLEAEDAFNVSSESEAKKGGNAKRRAPGPARQPVSAPAKAAKGTVASPAPAPARLGSRPSDDCSAASQSTGSGRASAGGLTQSACGTPPPLAGLQQHSPSGSHNSSAQRLGAPEAHAAAVSPAHAQHAQHAQHVQHVQHAQHAQQRFSPHQPEAMEVHVSHAPSAASVPPQTARASSPAPAVQQPDADLDSMLQQLLQDEDLRGLQVDPMEVRRAAACALG